MSEHKNDSFHNMNIRKKMMIVAGIALLIIFVVSYVFGLYFFGFAGVFKLLGVHYQSIWSLAVFVFAFCILGVIVEVITKVIFKLAVRNITAKIRVYSIRLSIEFTSNLLVLYTVDELIKTITLSMKTEIILALSLAILEIVFDDDK
ncbi:YrvL family regulatory protein [Oceanobacillus massiliensis]|uniref:YrvL family regulatory protein n=1 Tax=Oceanobacillus massiliensis TaxID=1465765 RepID=UPI000289801F|nr:YrvL family regulatory protein [Oceanobacillus massiliensis]